MDLLPKIFYEIYFFIFKKHYYTSIFPLIRRGRSRSR